VCSKFSFRYCKHLWPFTFKRITSWADFVTNMKSTNRVLLSLEVSLIFHNHVVRAKKKKLFCEWSLRPVITVLQDPASLIHLHHMFVSISFLFTFPMFHYAKVCRSYNGHVPADFNIHFFKCSPLFQRRLYTEDAYTDWETCYFILGNIIANALWCQRDTYT
jgi:hypothetical protein